MPFYLTNENIEETMLRNPDDIFNPSDAKHETLVTNTQIRDAISKEIVICLEKYTNKTLEQNTFFSNVKSFKEQSYFKYVFSFESDNDEYEILYYMPSSLDSLIKKNNENIENKNTKKEMFLSLSNLIVSSLNELELSFLQDLHLIDLLEETFDKKSILIDKRLYSFNFFIEEKEYEIYLHLDEQFNKIF